jgi:hypothetical protein
MIAAGASSCTRWPASGIGRKVDPPMRAASERSAALDRDPRVPLSPQDERTAPDGGEAGGDRVRVALVHLGDLPVERCLPDLTGPRLGIGVERFPG